MKLNVTSIAVLVSCIAIYWISSQSPLKYGIAWSFRQPLAGSIDDLEFSNVDHSSLATNTRVYLQDELDGAETWVFDGNLGYSGTKDGRIVEVDFSSPDEPVFKRTVARLGKIKDSAQHEAICSNGGYHSTPDYDSCGRPLGMTWATPWIEDNSPTLLVCDINGLLTVRISDGHIQVLATAPSNEPNLPFKTLNSVVVTSKGDVYITESSPSWSIKWVYYSMMEGHADGRLIHYSFSTGEAKTLLNGIHWANGIILSPDESYLIYSDMIDQRLMRYELSSGINTVWRDNMPGFIDNLMPDATGQGFYASLPNLRSNLVMFAISRPLVKKLLTAIIPHDLIVSLSPQQSSFIHFDWSSSIIDIYFDSSATHWSSHASTHYLPNDVGKGNRLIFGSYRAHGVAIFKPPVSTKKM